MEIYWTPLRNGHDRNGAQHSREETLMLEPRRNEMTPSADVIETKVELIVELDLPGHALEDIRVNAERNLLKVEVERKLQPEPSRTYHRSERPHGLFSRSFALPATVDPDGIRATYRSGVLSIHMPKREGVKPRTIPVVSGSSP